MLRKRIIYGRPNAVTSSFSPLQPCVLNSDLKYFNLSISHLEVTHIPKIVILAYFLTKLQAKKEVKKTEAESIAPYVSPTVTAGANNACGSLLVLHVNDLLNISAEPISDWVAILSPLGLCL